MYGFKIKINGQTIKIVEADNSDLLMGTLTVSTNSDDTNKLSDIVWWAGEVKINKLQMNDEISFEIIKLPESIGPAPIAIRKAI